MFTGIIEELGTIKKIVRGANATKLYIGCSKILDDLKLGDSIAVNGICLTCSEIGEGWFSADVMPETVRKTNFNKLKLSDVCNLERALKVSDRLGGHIVTGHIDGMGVISSVKREENATWITINAPKSVMKYVVTKGSVAVDGTSLTVVSVEDERFSISVIPLTANHTTIGHKKTGDSVNVECDIIGKYVEKLLNNKSGNDGISNDFLNENGFI